jgi:hypothetical protein
MSACETLAAPKIAALESLQAAPAQNFLNRNRQVAENPPAAGTAKPLWS